MARDSTTFVLIFILVLSGCVRKIEQKEEGWFKVDKFDLNVSDTTGWNCISVQRQQLCTPATWRQLQIKNVLFCADLGDSIENTYFVVSKFDSTTRQNDIKSHVKDLVNVALADSVETLVSYKITQLKFPDKIAFYVEFNLRYRSDDYTYFALIWQDEKLLYDFSLKTLSLNRERDYEIFQTLLYNFRSGNVNVFDNQNKLQSFKVLQIQDL